MTGRRRARGTRPGPGERGQLSCSRRFGHPADFFALTMQHGHGARRGRRGRPHTHRARVEPLNLVSRVGQPGAAAPAARAAGRARGLPPPTRGPASGGTRARATGAGRRSLRLPAGSGGSCFRSVWRRRPPRRGWGLRGGVRASTAVPGTRVARETRPVLDRLQNIRV